VLLAGFQGVSASAAFQNQGVVINPGIQFLVIGTLTLTAGTMFLMWLGEQITERGLGFLNASAEAPNYELTFGIKKNFEPKEVGERRRHHQEEVIYHEAHFGSDSSRSSSRTFVRHSPKAGVSRQ